MRTAIVGVGNLLMRDDGVGIHVARRLMSLDLPPNVEVSDCGTAAEAAFSLASFDRLIVVDAARLGGAPGTVYRLTTDDAVGPRNRSSHDARLIETLRLASGSDSIPEVIIFGIEPGEVTWGLELTADVEAAVFRLIAIVQEELKGS